MTHIRRNLTMTEARSYLKAALWEQHEAHLSQDDHTLVTLYAKGLASITETREDMPNVPDSELTKYLSILADELHANITKGE